MTVRLDDETISKLEQQGRIIPCVRHACAVCGQAIHDRPGAPSRPTCPHDCRVTPVMLGVDCRLCGAPVPSSVHNRLYCFDHSVDRKSPATRPTGLVPDGAYTMRLIDTHWHAAEGTGPVSQYAIP